MKYAPILLLLITSASALAQKNFVPGYVVFNNNDTLYGSIHFRSEEVNRKSIEFRKPGETTYEILDITQLSFFEITTKDSYQRAIVWKDMVSVNPSALEPEGFRKNVLDTVFLRRIAAGKNLSLYQLVDEKIHYYITANGKKPEELIYRVFHSRQDVGVVIRLHTFRDQLRKYADPADTKLIARIENLSYSWDDLIRVLLKLDNTAQSRYKLADEKGFSPSIRGFGGAGPSYSRLSYSRDSRYIGVAPTGYSLAVTAGIYVENKNGSRFFGTVAGTYWTFRGHADFIRHVPNSYETQTEQVIFDMHSNNFNLSTILNFSAFRSPDFRFYVGAGFGVNLSNYPKNEMVRINQTDFATTKVKVIQFKTTWTEISARAGMGLGKLDLFYSRRMAGGISNDNFVGVHLQTSGMMVTYSF